MSDKAEELARQLLEKTENGKLRWRSILTLGSESFRTDIEDGFSFVIKRAATGDIKVLTFELTVPQGVVLSNNVDNLLAGGVSFPQEGLGNSAFPRVNRFRLFSDLFYAAKQNAVDEDQTIEKVQQLLERLG
jgi:hypothetical protein